jgi:hypothetical protein
MRVTAKLYPSSPLGRSDPCLAFSCPRSGGKPAMEAASCLARLDANGAGLPLPVLSPATRAILSREWRAVAGKSVAGAGALSAAGGFADPGDLAARRGAYAAFRAAGRPCQFRSDLDHDDWSRPGPAIPPVGARGELRWSAHRNLLSRAIRSVRLRAAGTPPGWSDQ